MPQGGGNHFEIFKGGNLKGGGKIFPNFPRGGNPILRLKKLKMLKNFRLRRAIL